MPDNVLQTLQQLVQDVIAPDVRELNVRVVGLEKQIGVRFTAMEKGLEARDQKIDAQFKAIESGLQARDEKIDAQLKAMMAAIGESKAQAELTNMRVIASLE